MTGDVMLIMLHFEIYLGAYLLRQQMPTRLNVHHAGFFSLA